MLHTRIKTPHHLVIAHTYELASVWIAEISHLNLGSGIGNNNLISHALSHIYIYRVPQEECARLQEGIPYGKVYRYNPKHLCPTLNGYGDNGQRLSKH
jgi:hypothetical protein